MIKLQKKKEIVTLTILNLSIWFLLYTLSNLHYNETSNINEKDTVNIKNVKGEKKKQNKTKKKKIANVIRHP